MEELTEPEDWQFEPLRDLDRFLRCSICFEYFKTAVMMPNCSHNYCSLCIRKHLQNRQLCPMCSKPVMESQLQCNRLIDNLVSSFKTNRNAFMKLVAGNKNGMSVSAVAVGVATKSPVRVPVPPSASGSILDLTDSELSQGLNSDLPPMNTIVSGHTPSSSHAPKLGHASSSKKLPKVVTTQCKSSGISSREKVRDKVMESTIATSGGCRGDRDVSSSLSTSTANTTVEVSAIIHHQAPSHAHTTYPHSSNKVRTPSRKISEEAVKPQRERKSVGEIQRVRSGDAISVLSSPASAVGAGSRSSVGDVATPTSSNNTRVPCPVCQVMVFEKFINSHLDQCLNQLTTPPAHASSSSSSSSSRLKRLPKLVFNIMKDKELKKKLKEYHLPTQGKRDVLLKRIKEFTLLYNAECDSLNPRTMKEVAQEVERSERSKLVGGSSTSSRKGSTPSSASSSSSQSMSAGPSLPPPPQSSRKSSESDISEMKKHYVKAHDDHFSKLIADVRERELKRRLSSTPSSVTTSGNPSPPMALEPLVPVALEPLVSVAQGAGVATHENQEEDDDDDCVLSYSPVIPAACERGRSSSSSGGDRDDVRGDGGGWGVDGDLEEDSQHVFAPDSPTFSPPSSPLLLGKGTDRRVLRKTLSIPESPTTDLKSTPSSRKRSSNRYKRSNGISLSALYREEDEKECGNSSGFIGDEDPDFLPSISFTSPYKARKKQKRH